MREMSSRALAAARQQRLAPRAQQREIRVRRARRKMSRVRGARPRPASARAWPATSGSSAFSTTVAAWANIRDLARAYAATEA